MISKAKNVVKLEQVKKNFKSDTLDNIKLQVICSSGTCNGLFSFDPSLQLIAATGWRCVRLFSYKLEYCIDLLPYDSTFKQIQFLNGAGYLFLLTNNEFLIINLSKPNRVQHIDVQAQHFIIVPIFREHLTISNIFVMFMNNGKITVFNLNTLSYSKFSLKFQPVPCSLFLSNPRNPNQLLFALNNNAILYDICNQQHLLSYPVHAITTGCFHPNGIRICLCNSLGLHLFNREDSLSFYEHHIPNIKDIKWIINQNNEYFIVITDITTIYHYKDTLQPIKSINTTNTLFINNNPYFNHGSDYIYDYKLNDEFHITNLFPSLTHPLILNAPLSFISKLMHKHTELPFDIQYSIDIDHVYDQFELLVLINAHDVQFYQYATSPGMLMQSIHPLILDNVDTCAVYSDLLFVFYGSKCTIYSLQEESWLTLQEIPLECSYLGITKNGILCCGAGMVHCISCSIPDSNEALMNNSEIMQNNIHIGITSIPIPFDSIYHIHEDYYLIYKDNLMELVELDHLGPTEIINTIHKFEGTLLSKPPVLVHGEYIFIQLEHLVIIHNAEIVTMNCKYSELMGIGNLIIGINKTETAIQFINIFNTKETFEINGLHEENWRLFVNKEHLWLINKQNINIIGKDRLTTMTINEQKIEERHVPREYAIKQIYNLFFKKVSKLEETDYEREDGFYYDCLLDLEILFGPVDIIKSVETSDTVDSTPNPFSMIKQKMQDRGEELEVLNEKFEDLEQSGKNLLEFAKSLNRKK